MREMDAGRGTPHGGDRRGIGGHLGITECTKSAMQPYTYRSQSSIARRFVSHATSWMRITLWSADLRRIGSLGPGIEPTKTQECPKSTDNVRRTTVLCDNDVGLSINAIGETSPATPAPLGYCRRARDGSVGSPALS